jgi:4-hydroxy-3-polyprenylbenzoate decarboxylase
MDPIVVGVTGSSGAILAVRLLEVLRDAAPVHLVVTPAAARVLPYETGRTPEDLACLATSHAHDDLFAPIASGTFRTRGMVVVPCSMKTLAGVASGYSDSLLLRAADVTLKQRRPLVLVTRESPLSLIHIENMSRAARAGATILPPVLTMYSRPGSIADLLDHVVGKVCDVLGIETEIQKRWA